MAKLKRIAAIVALIAAVVVVSYVVYTLSLKPSYLVQYFTYDTVNGSVSATQGDGYVKYAITGEATLNMTVTAAVKDPYRLHKAVVTSLVENLTNMELKAFGLRFGLVYASGSPPANNTFVNATLTGDGISETAIAVKYLNLSGTIKLQVYVNNTLCMEYEPEKVEDTSLNIVLLHVPVSITTICVDVPANGTWTLTDADVHDKAMVTFNLFYAFDLVDATQSGSADVKISGYASRT